MERKEFEKFLEGLGLTLSATNFSKNEDGIETARYFYTGGDTSIVKVDYDKQEFSFSAYIPKTIFSIECPTCGSLSDLKRFEKMYNRFKAVALHNQFGIFD